MTRSFKIALLPLLVLSLIMAAPGCGGDEQVGWGDPDVGTVPPRGSAWVVFNGDTVVAEVADTPEARERGLMHRTEVPEGTGMLFVFDDEDIRQFWMRDTYVPLDIAFVNREQEIVDIQQMEPEDEEFTESASPAMYAVEVRAGWFEEQGIGPGASVEFVFGRR